jgi:hypothetical protein
MTGAAVIAASSPSPAAHSPAAATRSLLVGVQLASTHHSIRPFLFTCALLIVVGVALTVIARRKRRRGRGSVEA